MMDDAEFGIIAYLREQAGHFRELAKSSRDPNVRRQLAGNLPVSAARSRKGPSPKRPNRVSASELGCEGEERAPFPVFAALDGVQRFGELQIDADRGLEGQPHTGTG